MFVCEFCFVHSVDSRLITINISRRYTASFNLLLAHFSVITAGAAYTAARASQSGFFQLRQWHPFTRSLTTKAAKTLVQAFISCRLDYCNSLLYRVTDNVMSRCIMLQHASSPEPDVVTTLSGCYVNYTCHFLFGGDWSSNSPVWCSRHCTVKCLSTRLMISISTPKSTDDPSFGLLLITCARCYAQQLGRQKLWRCSVDPRIWNSLPHGLRTLDINYIHFKTLLKTYMFRIGHGALWHSI